MKLSGVAIALALAGLTVGATTLQKHHVGRASTQPVKAASSQAQDGATESPVRPEPATGWPAIARPRSEIPLRSSPGGAVVAIVGTRTVFGSPTRLAVIGGRGDWLRVISEKLRNGARAWVPAGRVTLSPAPTRIDVDITTRQLRVVRHDQVVLRASVVVGAADTPTPTGRFAVTDKLSGARFGRYYGCCVLALSGHQPNLPAKWHGGNRLAIHGTSSGHVVAGPLSAGCLRAGDAVLRRLMTLVSAGTLVVIHA